MSDRRKEEGDKPVTICHSCGTDLRKENVKYHVDQGHAVIVYEKDPRGKDGR